MLFNQTITIYNRYKDNGVDKWKRTVLRGVQVSPTNDKVIDNNGVLRHISGVSITILVRGGYKAPVEYEGKGFTFGLDNLDIVTLGICNKEITASYTITRLLRERPDTWTIKGVNDNTGRSCLKHWKVIAE